MGHCACIVGRGTHVLVMGEVMRYACHLNCVQHAQLNLSILLPSQVEDMEVVERILRESAYHNVTHPVGTVMRMADTPLPFTPKFEME